MLSFKSFVQAAKVLSESRSKPTYAAIKPDLNSRESIAELVESALESSSLMIPEDELHCTITYSRKPIADPTKIIRKRLPIKGVASEWRVFDSDGKRCLVLVISSVDVKALHMEVQEETGASYDYPEYIPHVTVCYDYPEDLEVPKMKMNLHLVFNDLEVRELED